MFGFLGLIRYSGADSMGTGTRAPHFYKWLGTGAP